MVRTLSDKKRKIGESSLSLYKEVLDGRSQFILTIYVMTEECFAIYVLTKASFPIKKRATVKI